MVGGWSRRLRFAVACKSPTHAAASTSSTARSRQGPTVKQHGSEASGRIIVPTGGFIFEEEKEDEEAVDANDNDAGGAKV